MHRFHMKLTKSSMPSTTTAYPADLIENNFTDATVVWPKKKVGGLNPFLDESSDVFFLVSVVAPLLFCCFAIFVCALNSIWKTRSRLEAMAQGGKQREPTEYTEFTIDLTTKMDSCVELSSPQISSKEESVLL
ncbi:unnamed protein product [Caenorhabditis sp. 36 PRJEB53466]|nr:unnamed protein product [Caenorhabditis sp. 36 PRJEB53466]